MPPKALTMRRAVCTLVLAMSSLYAQAVRERTPFPAPAPIAELGPESFKVVGVDGRAVTLNASDLYRLPQQTVKTTDHGAPVTFEGVLLSHVLAKVATPTGEQYQHTAASY